MNAKNDAHISLGGQIAAIALSMTVAAAGLDLVGSTEAFATDAAPAVSEESNPQAEGDVQTEESQVESETTQVTAGETTQTVDSQQTEALADTSAAPVTTENTVSATVTVTNNVTEASALYASFPALTRDTLIEQDAWQRAAETTILDSDTRPDGSAFTTVLGDSAQDGSTLSEYLGSSQDDVLTKVQADGVNLSSAQSIGIACVTDAAGEQHWVVILSSAAATQPVTTSEAGSDAAKSYPVTLAAANVAEVPATQNPVSLEVGGTSQLTMTTATGDGYSTQPITLSGWTFASSNEAIATVDATGLVTAAAAGDATITATSADGSASTSWSVTITDSNASQAKTNTAAAPEEESTDNAEPESTDTTGGTTENNQEQTQTEAQDPIDLSQCTINGGLALATELQLTSDGQPDWQMNEDGTWNFSLVAPDGATPLNVNDATQFSVTTSYDADNNTATLTIEPTEGNTAYTGKFTETFKVAAPQTDAAAKTNAFATDEPQETENTDGDTPEKPQTTDIETSANFTSNSNPTYNNGEMPTDLNLVVTLKDGTILTEGTDYEVSLDSYELGTHTVTVTGIGNYSGTHTFNVQIVEPAKQTLEAAGFSIQAISDQTFTGSQIQPKVTVSNSDGSTTLTEGQDYTIDSYQNNINAGTATVHIQATNSSEYTGDLTQTFQIVPASIDSTSVELYNQYENGGEVTTSAKSVKLGNYTLTEGTDYTISGYANNTAVGTATATLQGVGNFTGTKDAKFEIVRNGQQGDSSNLGTTATLPQTADLTSYALPLAAGLGGIAAIAGGTTLAVKRRRQNG